MSEKVLQVSGCYGIDNGELGGVGHFVSGIFDRASRDPFGEGLSLCGVRVSGERFRFIEQRRACPACLQREREIMIELGTSLRDGAEQLQREFEALARSGPTQEELDAAIAKYGPSDEDLAALTPSEREEYDRRVVGGEGTIDILADLHERRSQDHP